MRTLVLIRHAKAGDGMNDHARDLAERGWQEAPAIGQWLADHRVRPDRVVVSDALRTRRTWDLAAANLPVPGLSAELDERIYHNTIADLMDVITETPPDISTLVLVGHSPGLPELACWLDADASESLRAFPTSAVAVLETESAWSELDQGQARLRAGYRIS